MRRFYRLAPALAVALTISMVIIFLFGPIDYHENFTQQGIATLLLSGNFGAYKYSGNYFLPEINPLNHTWSLSVEEQIYIILPLVLMGFLHHRKPTVVRIAVVLGSISVISFVSFMFPAILQPVYSSVGIESGSNFSFYSPIERIWQFTIGGLGYLLPNRYHSQKWKILKSINFVGIITVIIILFSPIYIDLKVSSVIASLISLTLIVFKSLDALPEILISKLEWLGYRSYSIYLVHAPLFYLAKKSLVTQIGNGENRIVQTIIAFIASIVLGALIYSKIEKRYRHSGKNDHSSLKTVVVALVLTFVIPFSLFAGINTGAKKNYWGLDRSTSQPPYAGALDPKCIRDSPTGPPCVYTNLGASKSVLLLGDSHAGHISQAVVDAAINSNWNAVVWARSGCHVHFQSVKKIKLPNSCLSMNNQMKNWVLMNRPKAIIISHYMRSSYSQSNLRNALLELQSIVPNILLVENIPIFPDKKDFMVGRPLVMSAYQPPKSFKRSDMDMSEKNASDQMAGWAIRNNISTINFDSLFCNKEDCIRYSGSDWLYRDNNHLSVAGAELTVPQLTHFLQQF